MRILLVDDHQVVREGLRRMLEVEPDMEVVGEAADAEDALAKVKLLSPDLVLLDIKMPDVDGIVLTRRIKEEAPSSKVVILTLYEEYLAQAARAGASGYLLKDLKREELVRAIRATYQGRSVLDLTLSEGLFTEFATLAEGRQQAQLSEREQTILRLIADGTTTKGIAEKLFVSEATVKRGVRRLFEKLGVRNRSEAVSEAYKRRLI